MFFNLQAAIGGVLIGWWLFGQAMRKPYSFWKFLLSSVFFGKIAKLLKPLERAESELFRELLLKVLPLSEARIWPFWFTISGIFDISQTYSNWQKSRFFLTKMMISRLPTRLEPSMIAPWKAEILLFLVVWFVLLFEMKITKYHLFFKKSRVFALLVQIIIIRSIEVFHNC